MAGIHATAIVAPDAILGDDVEIGPYCLVGAGVSLGARTVLQSHVVVEGPTEIGEDCVIHPFASLGGPPQHLAYRGEPTRLVIGSRNVIREHVSIHRGTVGGRGMTSVGSDGYVMAQSHVAHDCVVGDHVVLAQGAALGGHVHLDDYVNVGGGAALHQGGRVGRHAMVGGMSGVHRDVVPFGSVYGVPAHIEGLNIIGLKRRGFPRETVNTLRASYRVLFGHAGTLKERVDQLAERFAGTPEVDEIVRFLRAKGARPICLPAER